MIIERTTFSDDSLKFNGYTYMGEYPLESLYTEKIFKPKEFAKRFCKEGVEEILYKTRIQQTSSTRLIKIFVKMENKH